MNKQRNPQRFSWAVARIVEAIGAEGAADAVEKSTSLVYKWADDDCDSLPTVRQAVQLDRAWIEARGGEGPITALMARKAHAGPLKTRGMLSEAMDLPAALARTLGHVQDAIEEHSPGGVHVTESEKVLIRASIAQFRQELDELDAALDRPDNVVPHRVA